LGLPSWIIFFNGPSPNKEEEGGEEGARGRQILGR